MIWRRVCIFLLTLSVIAGGFMVGERAWAFTGSQEDFRWYVNDDVQTVTDPWPPGATDLGENAGITVDDEPPQPGDILRLRLNVQAAENVAQFDGTVRIQYGEGDVCSAISMWTDLGEANTSEVWRFYDNFNVTDASELTDLLLASSNVKESYQESNPSMAPNAINDGEYAEWDFVIENNGAIAGASYCFRVVSETSGAFGAYTFYPQIETKPFEVKSQDWRWYGDENWETPQEPLALVNARPIGIPQDEPIKLRLTLAEIEGTSSQNQKYRLQYSTSTDFTNVAFVEQQASCDTEAWCYADGYDADDDIITTLLLDDSDTVGRHQESGTSPSTLTHPANASVEMEFTIQNKEAEPGVSYYFRAYDVTNDQPVVINTGESYPEVQTRMPILTFEIMGYDAGSQVGAYTLNRTSTASGVDFGSVDNEESYFAAHRLRVTHDGVGYQVSVFRRTPFQAVTGDVILDFPAPNDTPAAWSFTPSAVEPGLFGYHSNDAELSGASTRFADADTWAGFDEVAREIVWTSGTAENEDHSIVYRLEVSGYQPSHVYQTDILYVVVGTY